MVDNENLKEERLFPKHSHGTIIAARTACGLMLGSIEHDPPVLTRMTGSKTRSSA